MNCKMTSTITTTSKYHAGPDGTPIHGNPFDLQIDTCYPLKIYCGCQSIAGSAQRQQVDPKSYGKKAANFVADSSTRLKDYGIMDVAPNPQVHPSGLIPFLFGCRFVRYDDLLSFFCFSLESFKSLLEKAKKIEAFNIKTQCMQIIGRLTKDAEVRNLSMEKKVVNFSVAVSNRYTSKSSEKQEVTTFYDCSYWISEKVAPFLKKWWSGGRKRTCVRPSMDRKRRRAQSQPFLRLLK